MKQKEKDGDNKDAIDDEMRETVDKKDKELKEKQEEI